MLNQELKLNTKIFNADPEGKSTSNGAGVEKKATRDGFGEGMLQAGMDNENVVGLTADLTESTKMNLFADRFPERFIQVGIAEQNMASVASGIASMGKIPFMSSFSIFSPGRNWEQIRTTICYNNRPVKIIGTHAGLSLGLDGGSHQALEDIAITRVLPNMVVISPCDAIEAKKATVACAKTTEPTYIRLARNTTPIITTEDTPFEIGKAQIVFMPEVGIAEVGIIATGPILYKAILAAKELEGKGIKVKVMNLSTIKPLDEENILKLAREVKGIVTVEDHQIAGGMGSAVSEFLSQNYPSRMEFIGVRDSFGQSGTPEELYKYYGLEKEDIIKAVEKILIKNI